MTSTFLPGGFDFFSLLLVLVLVLALVLILVLLLRSGGSRHISRHQIRQSKSEGYPQNAIANDGFIDTVEESADEQDHVTEATMGIKRTEMNNSQDYRILKELHQRIKEKKGEKVRSKTKTNRVISMEEDEEPQENDNNSNNNLEAESPDNDIDKPAGDISNKVGNMVVAAIGGSPVFLTIVSDIKSKLLNSSLTPKAIKSKLSNLSLTPKDTKPQTLAPQLPLGEESIHHPGQNMTNINETEPQPQRKQWAGVGPKLTYQVLHEGEGETMTNINETKLQPQRKQGAGVGPKLTYQVLHEGEGETMTRYRQGCFQYKEAGSVEDISFEGSPTELAIKLGPGFEEAMLEAIVGMKSNGRRIIFIPYEVSGLEKNTFLDLKLITVKYLNPRSRI